MVQDIITGGRDADFIFIHDGFTSTITGSFAAPALSPQGIVIDSNGNLISSDTNQRIYQHSGISATLTGSFLAPGANDPQGLTLDSDGNLIIAHVNPDFIYIQSGISATTTGSFASPGIEPRGLAILSGNLISADTDADHIYIHDGISATLTGSFASPQNSVLGLVVDGNGNLVSVSADPDFAYLHSGISATLTGSFATPDTFTWGIAIRTTPGQNLVSNNASADHIFIHDGITGTILGSFAFPEGSSTDGKGMATDVSGNLLLLDSNRDHVYTYDGVSSTLTGSFATPGTPLVEHGIAVDSNNNLIVSTLNPDFIYIQDGLSSTTTGSFASPANSPQGLVIDSDGNLISADLSQDHIYIHSGISATLTGSFASPGGNPVGLTIDNNGNLISMEGGAADHIYIHSGISATITGSFAAPGGTAPWGLALYTPSTNSKSIEDSFSLSDTFSTSHKLKQQTVFTKITIGGSTVTDAFSANVRKATGDNNASSSFSITIDNFAGANSLSYNLGDEVKIFAERGVNPPTTQILTGILEDFNFKGKAQDEKLTLTGRDFSARMMDRVVEPEVYTSLPAGSIVKDIIIKYTDDITISNVNDSPTTVDRIQFKYTPVFDAVKQLAELSGYVFYVDNNKDLHFEEKSTSSSGFTFDSGNVVKADFKERRDTIFNEVWVRGDRYFDHFLDEFTAGSPLGGSIFTLTNKPHDTEIKVEGTLQKGGIFGMGGVVSGTNYLVSYEDKEIIFVSGTDLGYSSIPASGDSITVDYNRSLPIIAAAQSPSSQDTYGKRVKAIIDKNIKDPDLAVQIADKEIDENASPKKEGNLQINNILNVTPSQTCVVNLPWHNVTNQTYDIIEASYNFNKTRNLMGDVLSVKVNKKLFDVTDRIKNLDDRIRKLEGDIVDTDDIIARLETTIGSVVPLGSNWFVETSTATGSTSHLFATNFTPPTNPWHLASGTDQGTLAGSYTGSARAFGAFIIQASGGEFRI